MGQSDPCEKDITAAYNPYEEPITRCGRNRQETAAFH